MGIFNRLTELITNPEGRLSTTDTVSLLALVVSSIALLMCVAMNREPDTALGLYLGAWVTHAGVQVHQKMKTGPGIQPAKPQGEQDEQRPH